MPNSTTYDAIIIGQGLAGTTLAWQLIARGQRICMIDPDESVTSSKIAAGLLTPITGKNLALSPTFGAEIAEAVRFYAAIERRTACGFFWQRTAVRLFETAAERRKWGARARDPAFAVHLAADPWLDPAVIAAPHGHFTMASAQLDTKAYLAASRQQLEVITDRLDWSHDVTSIAETDHIVVGGRRTRWLISCEGYGAAGNPFWNGLTFRAAKGEILTLELEREWPPVSLHRGIWIAPTNQTHIVKVGATFSWDPLDTMPTPAARAELETKLATIYSPAWHITTHQAAVRPIIGEGRPVVVRHAMFPRVIAFNGLAAKGALRAPLAAATLADALVGGDGYAMEHLSCA